jgi:glutathione S-transferase
MSYALHYHRGIPGRGEFVRLLFVHAGTPFHDLPALPAQDAAQHFAPPLLRYTSAADAPPDFAAEVELSQTPVILYFLASRLGLAPSDEAGRLAVQQRVETILDLANEVHDVHHPVCVVCCASLARLTPATAMSRSTTRTSATSRCAARRTSCSCASRSS